MSASLATPEVASSLIPHSTDEFDHRDEVVMNGARFRLLIEDWLPIAALGEECARERRSMTALPPIYYLHVWWARRPLVASRAAILASVLPSYTDLQAQQKVQASFKHILGIHGDPVASRSRIDEARRTGKRFEGEAYTYRRAFTYSPSEDEFEWIRQHARKVYKGDELTVLDVTAGGGSIPFEAARLGLNVIANDLNPVAWLLLKATVEFPLKFGEKLTERFFDLASRFIQRRDERLQFLFPQESDPKCVATNWLWARTIYCPYCSGKIPLSPNWRLNSKGKGVRLVQRIDDAQNRHFTFEMVNKAKDHSPGTVKKGDALCPFSDCGRLIDGDEIKAQGQSGTMGQQLYAIVFRREEVTGYTKNGKPKIKNVRGFRSPRPEDDVQQQVVEALERKMPAWIASDLVPSEERYIGPADRSAIYGIAKYTDLFSPRQLYSHLVSVEVYRELSLDLCNSQDNENALDNAALTYIALTLDKMLNYNSRMSVWMPTREVVANTFNRHDFAFCWSHCEMAPTSTGVGYDWAFEQTGKAIKELIDLAGHKDATNGLFSSSGTNGHLKVYCESADELQLEKESVDCIVMDPPYYDNVMYAELSDFFYVWLKRTAGLLYPDVFSAPLTDKDREAIANSAKFKGQKGAKALAGQDYEERMARIFERCRYVLKSHGVMTVMFTHKSSSAWDFLANALVQAGFVITASWPVNTEAESSLHIKEKSAAKSTIFLVCRPRENLAADADTVYWEEVEPLVVEAVRRRVGEFQAAGIGGVDLYLACFGAALQVFSEKWPLRRGRALQRSNGNKKQFSNGDPYAVRPEDALDAARREVKSWRMDQLATVKRQHHLDPLTEWYVLAWDTFKAPRFSADEALRLARVVGLDFDRHVKNVVCEVKASDVLLWDSKARQAKNKLGGVGEDCILDTLHQVAILARDVNTGAAKTVLEEAGLIDDPTLLTALEALLNVLPPSGAGRGKKGNALLAGAANDFEALERLRKLAFMESVPPPQQKVFSFMEDESSEAEDAEDE